MDGYRLPTNIIPDTYDLTLYPDLDTGLFKGKVTAKLNVLEDVPEIKVHSNKLNIIRVNIDGKDAVFKLDNKFELVIITASNHSNISRGPREVTIEYDGDMKNRIVGLYTSSYTAQDGNKKAIATTKFEPTYARQAFPCFDEPNMKAKYTVHILKPKNSDYIALSNMPQSSEDDTPDGTMVHFKESVKMSTYLSCFIVCDFKSKDDTINSPEQGKIPIKVFATPAQVEKTGFALKVAIKIIEYFIGYFKIDYPLPKLDLIAIPDFVSGAMEHWGLVTFRETSLLFDEKLSSSANKQSIAGVIAHELAHSWFGNLVTMNWWNDLWLNEGFASYIEYKGLHESFPDWQMLDQFLIKDLHSVLSTDATEASHPIVQTVLTPDEITEIFDSITYSKGASILRMLEMAVGEQIFEKGVTAYLQAHKWENAVTQDLWDELQKLVPSTINITDLMSTWTVQMGYPVLTIEEEGSDFVLTQKRFLKDYSKPGYTSSIYGYKWTVPVTYITDKDPDNPTLVWFKHDEPKLTIKRPEGIKWIKFNHKQIGYYRVNYNVAQWQVLVDNIKILSISDKTHLLEESFSIAESGDLPYDVPLDLTKYLVDELNYVPWSVASSKLSGLKKYLVDSLLYSNYIDYVLSLIKPAYDALTWIEDVNDSHLKRQARLVILKQACANGHAECLNEATKRFKNWLNDPVKNAVSPDLKTIVYYYGMLNSGKDEWFQLLEIFKKEIDASEKKKLLDALSAVKETWLLKHLIELGTIEGKDQIIRGQDYFTMLEYISNNPIGTSIVWDYVRENWQYLVDRFTLNNRYLGKLIPSITRSFTTKTKLAEIEAFFEANPEAGAGKTARAEALATTNNNINWIEKNRAAVEDWIRNNAQPPPAL